MEEEVPLKNEQPEHLHNKLEGSSGTKSGHSACLTTSKKCAALFAVCFVYFLSLVMYDYPSSLQSVLLHDLSYSALEFAQLMSSYTWTSALCFLGGFYIDRVTGMNKGMYTFVAVFTTGCIIYAAGIYTQHLWVMVIGRCFQGFGGECLAVVASCYIIFWFSESNLNLAFAMSYSSACLAPAVTFQISYPLYAYVRRLYQQAEYIQPAQSALISSTIIISGSVLILMALCSIAIGFLYNSSKKDEPKNRRKEASESNDSDFKLIWHLPLIFWMLLAYITLMHVSLYTYVSFAQEVFGKLYGSSVDEADSLVSLFSVTLGLSILIQGYLVDKTGRNLYYQATSVTGASLSHILITFTDIYPSVTIITLGVSISFFIGTYSSLIAKCVKEHQVGTAYGMSYSVMNMGTGFGFMIVGFLNDNFGTMSLEYFHILILLGALVLCIAMLYLDRKGESKLNAPQTDHNLIKVDSS